MIINQRDYKEILTEVGYPIVTEDDLEFKREDIEELMIYPALREFFIWFPLTERQSLHVNGYFEVAFPDEDTFGISDARINTNMDKSGQTGSPFMNELLINRRGSSSIHMYGTQYDYGVEEALYSERAYSRATQNNARAKDIRVDDQNRIVSGYSTAPGELIISWAKTSEDFNNVPYRRKAEVINLSKANVLRAFGMLRGQLDADTDVQFNPGEMISRAEDLEESVLNKWRGMTKVAIIRN